MLKYFITLLLLATAAAPTLAQSAISNTAKQVDQYCVLVAVGGGMSTKLGLSIDFGEETDALGKQQSETLEHVKTLTSVSTALNYLSKQGWELVAVHDRLGGNHAAQNYFLRRHP